MNEQAKDHVVIKDGQRASGLMTETDANQEAARQRGRLNESTDKPQQESRVQVKQNICG